MQRAGADEEKPDGPGDEGELDRDERGVPGTVVRAAGAEDVAAVEREPHRPDDERERERRRGEGQEVSRAPVAPEAPGRAQAEVDRGAEGEVDGEAGGELIAAGTPEQVAEVEESVTGQYLRQVLPAREPAAA